MNAAIVSVWYNRAANGSSVLLGARPRNFFRLVFKETQP